MTAPSSPSPLQWISATSIAGRYGDLIGFRLRAETFSQFLDEARLGFSQLKEMLENNPLRLKSQLMTITGRAQAPDFTRGVSELKADL
jgi:hypothetical protein